MRVNDAEIQKFFEVLEIKDAYVVLIPRNGDNNGNNFPERKFVRDYQDFQKLVKYLRYKNVNNYDIYISINEFLDEKEGRNEKNAKQKQSKLYFDLDGDKMGRHGIHILEDILERYSLPRPTLVVQSSAMNLQVYWKLKEDVEFGKLKAIMRKINYEMQLDKTQDVSRIFRLPNFFSRKKGFLVRVLPNLSSFEKYDYSIFEKIIAENEKEEIKKEQKEEIKKNVKRDVKGEARGEIKGEVKEKIITITQNAFSDNRTLEIEKYQELIEEEVKEKFGIEIDLSTYLQPGYNYTSYSHVDWYFVIDLFFIFFDEITNDSIRAKIYEIIKIAREKVRDNKLQRSPNYVDITIENVLKKNQGILEKRKKEKKERTPEI